MIFIDGACVHQFDESGFDAHFATADCAGIEQDLAVFVKRQVDFADGCVCDENVDAFGCGLCHEIGDFAVEAGDCADAEGDQDDAVERGFIAEQAFERIELNARGDVDDHDVGVEIWAATERCCWAADMLCERDVDAEFCEGLAAGGIEGVIGACVDFAGTAAAQKQAVKTNGDFGDVERGDFDRVGEIAACVVAKCAKRALSAREDDRFVETFERESECRGRVGHRVCAVYDDKAVIFTAVVCNHAGQIRPLFWADVR